jgi:AcrR family transcriptional regulator
VASLEDIIAAAARVFQTKGYHAATVQDIADAVGILKGSLYHHVKSKEDLLYLIVKEPIARIYERMTEIADGDSPPGEKLRRAIHAHLEALARHYPHLFVSLHEREEMKHRFREQFKLSPKQYERCWQQILREGVKSGAFRPDLDVQVVSYGLLGMLNWLYKWYDPRGRLDVREIAEQFSMLALSGLTAAQPNGRPSRKRRRR